MNHLALLLNAPPTRPPKLWQTAEGRKSRRKEESAMKYVKPSIATLGVASETIQGDGSKKFPHAIDGNVLLRPQLSTGSAYDLDE